MAEAPTSPASLLDPEAISRAERLGLQARFVVEGHLAGDHKSPFRGFAIEFTQHREYVPGDDLRHLDWKILGRTDRYYLKQYEQETNYVAHLLLDVSESMRYGSGPVSKLLYGKRLVACLAYLILRRRDATACALFDDGLRQAVPRTGSLGMMNTILQTLAAAEPRSSTRIASVLHDMAGQIRRKGIVILVSDLFDDEAQILDGIQHLRFGGNEVIVFHVLDPYELEFPFKGLVEFEGLEALPRIMTRPREIRKSYLREIEAFRARIREGCERNQSHYVLVNTATPLYEALAGYLAFRLRTAQR